MGSACSGALFGDDSRLNPKLRPPPLVGVLFSLITTFSFIVWILSFRMSPINLFLCAVLCVFFGAIAVSEGSAWERRYPSIVLLGPIAIVSALLAVYIGVKINVKFYSPYLLATEGREYSNVPPLARTAEFADGGILGFSDDATLDTSRSFGFKASDFTYCVAPVVSKTAEVHPTSAGQKITFWAVGKDCCGSRSDFDCDGAGDTEVRSAFTVRDVNFNWVQKLMVPRTSRPQYLKAVAAAKAVHNLQSENDEEIILLRWAADPHDTLKVWSNRTMIAVAVACILYSVFIIVLWTGIHMYFDKSIRTLAAMSDAIVPGTGRGLKNPFLVSGNV